MMDHLCNFNFFSIIMGENGGEKKPSGWREANKQGPI